MYSNITSSVLRHQDKQQSRESLSLTDVKLIWVQNETQQNPNYNTFEINKEKKNLSCHRYYIFYRMNHFVYPISVGLYKLRLVSRHLLRCKSAACVVLEVKSLVKQKPFRHCLKKTASDSGHKKTWRCRILH